MAKDANYTAAISHRSGETEDPIIADLVVATALDRLKLVLYVVLIVLLNTTS